MWELDYFLCDARFDRNSDSKYPLNGIEPFYLFSLDCICDSSLLYWWIRGMESYAMCNNITDM